jgi:nucleoid-associated protein
MEGHMSIAQAIIHKLDKEQHGKAILHKREKVLVLNEPVLKLVGDIQDFYTKRPSKGHGRFEADEMSYPTAKILRSAFQDDSLPFVDASHQLLALLAARADQAPLATGGYVLMAEISDSTARWFVVAIINNASGNAIDDASLEVINTVHVNLADLRVAGRVNLTDWLGGDENLRYVGFLKQRGQVAEYFKLFLGCKELIANNEETTKAVRLLKRFADANSLDPEGREKFLQAAYSFCQESTRNNTPLSLESLSNAVWPHEPSALQTALATADLQLSDGFVPDARVLKSLIRIKAKTAFWSIDLDRHALISGEAEYHSEQGELVFRKLPKELIEQLEEEVNE